MTSVKVDLDNACPGHWIPSVTMMEKWLSAASHKLPGHPRPARIGIRIVDETGSAALNRNFRGKDYPTNVLSFICDLPALVSDTLKRVPLGDLAICAPIVDAEASNQGKSQEAHWAHLLTHGFLHLHGFTHDTAPHAEAMESLEIRVLEELGFPNPYLIN
ncbi:MAG: rRNA maturation RNase YbeY [Gammaproteobacteria bacterium]|nr:rRNA maturation RNase YbeY [Pseudomonadales bacterium]MCP5345653.1 rRNA maturation RNase YbeY [Pseudomonadales bacterium]